MGRLFLRIFLWFWLGSTSLLLVLAATLLIERPEVFTSWRVIRQTAMRQVGAQAADAFEHEGSARAAAVLDAAARELRFGVWLYAADGSPVGAPAPIAGAAALVARALEGDDVERTSGGGTTDAPLVLARRVTSRSGRAYVLIWESPFRWRSPPIPSMRLLALVLTGGAFCWWLAWQITRPIRTLRETTRRFSEGDLGARVGGARGLRRGDELSELARDFDLMAGRIEAQVTSQQQLLADISHELRSPLARLSLALDLARRRVGDSVPEHQRIEREIHRLNELIGQLLTLTRLQGDPSPMRTEPVDLRALIRDVADDARFEAEPAGRDVVVSHACDDVTIRGSRTLLRSAIENVVRNAVRHTPVQTAVTIDVRCDPIQPSTTAPLVSVADRTARAGADAWAAAPAAVSRTTSGTTSGAAGRATPRRVVIVVRDRGPGVPPEALPRLFDPFYRVDEARDRASGGLGLGLAITRQAMLAHGGLASAENHPDGGLSIRLELPLALPPDAHAGGSAAAAGSARGTLSPAGERAG